MQKLIIMGYILSIDQGTTSTRAIAFDKLGNIVFSSREELKQYYPAEGMVEHDAEEIAEAALNVSKEVISRCGAENRECIGITNQRETSILWDRKTGKPVSKAIVWQDRRTADFCRELISKGLEQKITEKTGLVIDPYFSATKVRWMLKNIPEAKELAEKGDLAFGTVDSYLLYVLTEGRSHCTDVTNACRTMLFNIHNLSWDTELLGIFEIPESILPEVKRSADDFGRTKLFGKELPIYAMAGDQQAATFGQCCFEKGSVKSTYGTGCFMVANTGSEPVHSKNRLLTTIAYMTDDKPVYAMEGSIFVAGAAIQWLRDGIKLIETAPETEKLAASIGSNRGVYMVPAFTGLGAPYWDPEARGAILGLSRDTGIAEIVRAALESVCYQTLDLLNAMKDDIGLSSAALKVDGGMAANDWLLQFMSDLMNMEISRPSVIETTALGASYMAGLYAGIYSDLKDIQSNSRTDRTFTPQMKNSEREKLITGWQKAVAKVRG